LFVAAFVVNRHSLCLAIFVDYGSRVSQIGNITHPFIVFFFEKGETTCRSYFIRSNQPELFINFRKDALEIRQRIFGVPLFKVLLEELWERINDEFHYLWKNFGCVFHYF
jgi:hypothetical protein